MLPSREISVKPHKSARAGFKTRRPRFSAHACNSFSEQFVQLALQLVETIRGRRRIRIRSATSGALSRERRIRNVLRGTVMTWRTRSEPSLARVVHYPWMAEMPKEAYKAYEESHDPVINRRSWMRVVCAGIRSCEIGQRPERSGDRRRGSDESQEGAQQARQEARNE